MNDICSDFKFVVCFAPLWHEVYRNIIFDLGSTAERVKSSKWESGDTPTRRAWLRVLPRGSVVGVTSSHVLGSLIRPRSSNTASTYCSTVPWFLVCSDRSMFISAGTKRYKKSFGWRLNMSKLYWETSALYNFFWSVSARGTYPHITFAFTVWLLYSIEHTCHNTYQAFP